MVISKPFHLLNWIKENEHLLKPPVGNQQVYKLNSDFIVMVVGGPNARKDFHYNEGEELFYQLKGNISLRVKQNDTFEDITINEGEMFLLPHKVPHLPKRGVDTIGLVIERYRKADELDGFIWYCENCGNTLYETYLPITNIVTQLPEVMNTFYHNQELCTCKTCGAVMERP